MIPSAGHPVGIGSGEDSLCVEMLYTAELTAGSVFWATFLFSWPYFCIPMAFAVDRNLRARWLLEDVSRPASGYRFKGTNIQMVFTSRSVSTSGTSLDAVSEEEGQMQSRRLDCTNLWPLTIVVPAVFVCAAEWTSGTVSLLLVCTPFVFLVMLSLTLSEVIVFVSLLASPVVHVIVAVINRGPENARVNSMLWSQTFVAFTAVSVAWTTRDVTALRTMTIDSDGSSNSTGNSNSNSVKNNQHHDEAVGEEAPRDNYSAEICIIQAAESLLSRRSSSRDDEDQTLLSLAVTMGKVASYRLPVDTPVLQTAPALKAWRRVIWHQGGVEGHIRETDRWGMLGEKLMAMNAGMPFMVGIVQGVLLSFSRLENSKSFGSGTLGSGFYGSLAAYAASLSFSTVLLIRMLAIINKASRGLANAMAKTETAMESFEHFRSWGVLKHGEIGCLTHIAARKGMARVLRYLVRNGANPNALDSTGKTPLAVAKVAGMDKARDYLEKFEGATRLNASQLASSDGGGVSRAGGGGGKNEQTRSPRWTRRLSSNVGYFDDHERGSYDGGEREARRHWNHIRMLAETVVRWMMSGERSAGKGRGKVAAEPPSTSESLIAVDPSGARDAGDELDIPKPSGVTELLRVAQPVAAVQPLSLDRLRRSPDPHGSETLRLSSPLRDIFSYEENMLVPTASISGSAGSPSGDTLGRNHAQAVAAAVAATAVSTAALADINSFSIHRTPAASGDSSRQRGNGNVDAATPSPDRTSAEAGSVGERALLRNDHQKFRAYYKPKDGVVDAAGTEISPEENDRVGAGEEGGNVERSRQGWPRRVNVANTAGDGGRQAHVKVGVLAATVDGLGGVGSVESTRTNLVSFRNHGSPAVLEDSLNRTGGQDARLSIVPSQVSLEQPTNSAGTQPKWTTTVSAPPPLIVPTIRPVRSETVNHRHTGDGDDGDDDENGSAFSEHRASVDEPSPKRSMRRLSSSLLRHPNSFSGSPPSSPGGRRGSCISSATTSFSPTQSALNITWALRRLRSLGTTSERRASFADLRKSSLFRVPDIYLLAFSDLVSLGEIPCRTGDRFLGHPSKRPTTCTELAARKAESEEDPVMVYVSHRWLEPDFKNPDNYTKTRFYQVCCVVRRLAKRMSRRPVDFYLWIDYASINQQDPSADRLAVPYVLDTCDVMVYIEDDEYWDQALCRTEHYVFHRLRRLRRPFHTGARGDDVFSLSTDGSRLTQRTYNETRARFSPNPAKGVLTKETDRLYLWTLVLALEYEMFYAGLETPGDDDGGDNAAGNTAFMNVLLQATNLMNSPNSAEAIAMETARCEVAVHGGMTIEGGGVVLC